MTGAYLRVRRENGFEAIEVEYLTDAEREEAFTNRSPEELVRWMSLLSKKLAECETFLSQLPDVEIRTEPVASAGVSPATPGTQDFPAFQGIKVEEIDAIKAGETPEQYAAFIRAHRGTFEPEDVSSAIHEAQSGLMATPKTLPPQ